jgi:hypothetical protein
MPCWTLVCNRFRRYESSDLAIYHLAWSTPRHIRAGGLTCLEIEYGRWKMDDGAWSVEQLATEVHAK